MRAEPVSDPAEVERVLVRAKYGSGDRITDVVSWLYGAKLLYRVTPRQWVGRKGP